MFDKFPIVLSSCIGRTLLIKFQVSFECFMKTYEFSQKGNFLCDTEHGSHVD